MLYRHSRPPNDLDSGKSTFEKTIGIMGRDTGPSAGKTEAGMRTVIVLSSLRKPSLTSGSKSELETVTAEDVPQSDDPAVIRKIVRRQAALASAARRKATLAALSQKRTAGRLQHQHAPHEFSNTNGHHGHFVYSPDLLPSPSALTIDHERFDPFTTHAVNLEAVHNSGLLRSLFSVFMGHVAPLLDLRLPTQEDRKHGRRYSWQKDLPQLALASPPCFWAVMLSAAGQVDSIANKTPSSSVMTLKFRHMTIRSINQRLDASSSRFRNDFGLLIGIAILGSWEHWWGSSEACQAHCDGLRMLRPHFEDREQPHDLFAQVMTFANTFGTKGREEPQGPKFAQDLPKIVELRINANIGFEWAASKVYLDQRLVRSICSALDVESLERGLERSRAVRDIVSVVLSFNTKPRLKTVFTESDWSQNQDGDRINLEMHIILQAAGISLFNFLADSPQEAGTADIDMVGMCEETSDLARSVACLPVYDPILTWALVTIFSLSGQTPPAGMAVLHAAARRLQLAEASTEALHHFMEPYTFLETAREHYYRFWSTTLQTWPRSPPAITPCVNPLPTPSSMDSDCKAVDRAD